MGGNGKASVTQSQQGRKKSLKERAGNKAFAPLVPPDMREAMATGLLEGSSMLETAENIRARYRDGEFAESIAAGEFGHLDHWSLEDWRAMVGKVRSKIPVDEYNAARLRFKLPGQVAIKPIVASVMEAKRATRKTAARVAEIELRKAQILAESEALEAIKAAETPAEEEADAQARLELLRRKIKAKLSVDEEADILVGLARGDNAAMARAALAQIQEILGVKAANVPETPGMASIFAFPEGSGGPAIR